MEDDSLSNVELLKLGDLSIFTQIEIEYLEERGIDTVGALLGVTRGLSSLTGLGAIENVRIDKVKELIPANVVERYQKYVPEHSTGYIGESEGDEGKAEC